MPQRRYAIVHAGAQLPSRRWPAERFAAVADALVGEGCDVLLTGSAGEAALLQQVQRAMRRPARSLAGATSLGVLGALVERAALVVCNDTGVSHVAAALRTPSVVVASGSDVERWAPQYRARHHVVWHDVECRPCGWRTCPIGHPCALGVGVERVIDAARAALRLPRS
jgi:ADP-heptose:LPS heptosyltransferase